MAVTFNFECLQAFKEMKSLYDTALDREAFVENMLHKVYYDPELQEKYNVLVVNLRKSHLWRKDPEGVKCYKDITYRGITYGMWVFESGIFQYTGEGSPGNLVFKGTCEVESVPGRHKVIEFKLPEKAKFYTVVHRDTVFKIATKYGTTVADIQSMNKETLPDVDIIFPLQVLRVRR